MGKKRTPGLVGGHAIRVSAHEWANRGLRWWGNGERENRVQRGWEGGRWDLGREHGSADGEDVELHEHVTRQARRQKVVDAVV